MWDINWVPEDNMSWHIVVLDSLPNIQPQYKRHTSDWMKVDELNEIADTKEVNEYKSDESNQSV